jgi:hypothetical protein
MICRHTVQRLAPFQPLLTADFRYCRIDEIKVVRRTPGKKLGGRDPAMLVRFQSTCNRNGLGNETLQPVRTQIGGLVVRVAIIRVNLNIQAARRRILYFLERTVAKLELDITTLRSCRPRIVRARGLRHLNGLCRPVLKIS